VTKADLETRIRTLRAEERELTQQIAARAAAGGATRQLSQKLAALRGELEASHLGIWHLERTAGAGSDATMQTSQPRSEKLTLQAARRAVQAMKGRPFDGLPEGHQAAFGRAFMSLQAPAAFRLAEEDVLAEAYLPAARALIRGAQMRAGNVRGR
jgi:hypothetical protein